MKLLIIRVKQLVETLIFGFPITIWLLLRNRHTIYYIPHVGLGDYCIALGYLGAYKSNHCISHVTLIVPPNRIEVAKFYSDWDSMLCLPMPLYKGIAYFGSIPGGRFIHRRVKRIKSVSFALHLNKKILYNNPAAHADELTKLILKIPITEKRQPPLIPGGVKIDYIINRYKLKQNNTVLINPYTGGWAVKQLEFELYENIAKKLMQAGYTVATILGSEKQVAVKGTEGIVASLAEAWYLVRWCGWLIGTRSGFFDFVQFSGCNMIAIYEKSYKEKEIYRLFNNKKTYINEYIWDGNEDILNEIILNLKKALKKAKL